MHPPQRNCAEGGFSLDVRLAPRHYVPRMQRRTAQLTVLLLAFLFAVGSAWAYYARRQARYEKEAAPPAVDIGTYLASRNAPSSVPIAVGSSAPPSTVPSSVSSATLPSSSPPPSSTVPAAGGHGGPPRASSSLVPAPSQDLPPHLNLASAFYPQAPFADWSMPWQEACEEASVLLVANTYYHHDWTREQFRDQILALIGWETKRFGAYENTNATQTAEMLNGYLGLQTVIHDDPTYEDVQRVLASGHLIVMLFAGKELGNPFYKNGGPLYHAMVIKGYAEGEKVITSDVGTKRGENYVYPWATLQGAMHEWAVPITSGAKKMIEVLPPQQQ